METRYGQQDVQEHRTMPHALPGDLFNGTRSTQHNFPSSSSSPPRGPQRRSIVESDEFYLREMRAILHEPPNTGPLLHPARFLEHIYMGSQKNADNVDLLQRLGITHVLNCAGLRRFDFTRSPYPRETGVKGFLMISAEDSESFDIARHFDEAIAFLDRVKRARGRALVHCNLGVNRSGAIVAAYLMVDQQQTLLQVTRNLKLKRSVVLTNKGFRRQLVNFARDRNLLDYVIIDHVTPPDNRENLTLTGKISACDRQYDDFRNNLTGRTSGLGSLTTLSLSESVNSSPRVNDVIEDDKKLGILKDRTSENLTNNGKTVTKDGNDTMSLSIRNSNHYQTLPRHLMKNGINNGALTSSQRSCIPNPSSSSGRSSSFSFNELIPTVQVTLSSDITDESGNNPSVVDQPDNSKSWLRPYSGSTTSPFSPSSQLSPVYELSATGTSSSSSSASTKFSGFWTLLGSKRKPTRSKSYSNVSSQTVGVSPVVTTTITAPPPQPPPPSGESQITTLSTSRPLRVYTRSSTDSELYKTKTTRMGTAAQSH